MQLSPIPADTIFHHSKLALSLASTMEEVREVQRLRYKVFIEGGGMSRLYHPDGLDQDEFDSWCDHLIVRDTNTLKVVGTYRVLSPQAAIRAGSLYSEKEFNLGRLDPIRGRIAEAGRACIHPDYRGGAVLLMLWGGLAAYMKRHGCDYLAGCASVSLADGGRSAAALSHLLYSSSLAPSEYRVTPRLAFPVHAPEPGYQPQIPALIKGYLRGGAWICGEPAWDPDFHCADFFMLLPLVKLERRYARHYLKEHVAQ